MRGNKDWELYDLKKDIGQKHNIAAQHPVVVKEMEAAYDQWWQKVLPNLVNENAYKTAPSVNPFKTEYRKQFGEHNK